MNANERRKTIKDRLKACEEPVSAARLAELFGVTRQIIVADIALLRAQGEPIRAEHRGYVMEKEQGTAPLFSIVCRHTREQIRDEFYAVVDNGGRVMDVTVDHIIYGTISVDLHVASRFDADEFMKKTGIKGATQLSDLTGGVHAHTVSAPNEESFRRICDELSRLGILIERA